MQIGKASKGLFLVSDAKVIVKGNIQRELIGINELRRQDREAILETLSKNPKEIKLKMMQVSDHLTIEMTNPTSESLKRVNGKIASHKEEPILHGFGLQTIEEIVNKYNGNLDVAQVNGLFTLKVYMQNQVNIQ